MYGVIIICICCIATTIGCGILMAHVGVFGCLSTLLITTDIFGYNYTYELYNYLNQNPDISNIIAVLDMTLIIASYWYALLYVVFSERYNYIWHTTYIFVAHAIFAYITKYIVLSNIHVAVITMLAVSNNNTILGLLNAIHMLYLLATRECHLVSIIISVIFGYTSTTLGSKNIHAPSRKMHKHME